MSMLERVLAALVFGLFMAAPQAQDRLGIGQPASQAQIRAWDIDIGPDGQGLPVGRGSVQDGARVFREKCSVCHGENGQGKPMDRLAGGAETLATPTPVKTIGSYWPYATTLYDFIYRAMPFTSPQSLTPDEVYALSAYLLYLNGIVGKGAVMDAHTLPRVRMPNRGNFVTDPRPDVANVPCRADCR